jgi:hypothetical protein
MKDNWFPEEQRKGEGRGESKMTEGMEGKVNNAKKRMVKVTIRRGGNEG